MKKIVILGNSVAAAEAIAFLRANNYEATITLILTENHLPYSREGFTDYVSNKKKIESLIYKEKYW